METIVNHPVLLFLVTFLLLWGGSYVGSLLRRRHEVMPDDEREDFNMILAAMLTLLGLIIGFTFSMAISRYDQRKNYEEEEANAIGTEYLRADLLPTESAEKVKSLLKTYLDLRIQHYTTENREERHGIDDRIAVLEAQLWEAVRAPGVGSPTPVTALAIAGMNDVLNSQGYSQAAWWNRIPLAAWGLMWVIAIACNMMIGYYVRPADRYWLRVIVMPIVVSISFLLVADIDSPRGGIIRVHPQNLTALASSLK